MWLLLLGLALGTQTPPDYDLALAEGEWLALNQLMEQGCRYNQMAGAVVCERPAVLDEVIARAEAWSTTVQPDAGLTYLAGLAWRYKGEHGQARVHWERATREDPDYRAPWYDLGELYLGAGEVDKARHAFEQVARLTEDPSERWIAPWRLAEVAASAGDPQGFEAHMRESLKHGFSFDNIAGLPNWKAYLADPKVGPSVEKLISVYSSRDVLESLRN